MTEHEVIKVRAGNYRVPVTLIPKDGRLFMKFAFNRKLLNEVKAMEKSRWHPELKLWSIEDNQRNHFQLDYLMEKNPYARYDAPLIDINTIRPVREHQRTMSGHMLSKHYCIIAGEMGVGKTLSMIEMLEYIEHLEDNMVWYVGPRAGVRAVGREILKWDSAIHPIMLTYNALVTKMKNWLDGQLAPRVVIFDESSKLKNPTAQRSEAALHLANAVRAEWGDNGYVILMSGSPAPKAPTDWWHQCEVACPGFLREGNIHKFKNRLCIVEERQSITGGVYPHIVTWLDSEKKCAICGQYEEKGPHDEMALVTGEADNSHEFKPSINEVEYLYKRMHGLVLVLFKKDCLDLPDKQYEIIEVKPSVEILRAARLIRANVSRAVTVLTLLRELSDGFQYKEVPTGEKVCPGCKGKGTIMAKVPKVDVDINNAPEFDPENFETQEIVCDCCGGDRLIPIFSRDSDAVGSPKDEVFIELLDEHEEIGRFLVWGGFQGTLDRLVAICHQQGWSTLRIDGRGYFGQDEMGNTLDVDILLDAMDRSHPKYTELLEKYPKLCVVGHPQAGGMALTLTASPTALYYSNSFDGEGRIQSEDRFHRMGMDENKGGRVIDLIMLPSDRLVRDNLMNKKRLQSISLGDIKKAFDELGDDDPRLI